MPLSRSFIRLLSTLPEDHYKNLNIEPTTDLTKIKRSFRRLSKKLHPDVLQSQELSEDALEQKKNHYMKIKRSYELLMDPAKKSDYDRIIAMKTASSSLRHSPYTSRVHDTSNAFHYSRRRSPYGGSSPGFAFTSGDPSHFDSKKHYERNLKNEKRTREHLIIQFGDLFRHNLSTRDIAFGIRKDLHQFHTNEREAERERLFLWRLFLGFSGFMLLWGVSIGRSKGTIGRESEVTRSASSEETDSSTPSSNNEYSTMLITSAVNGSGGRT